MAGKLHYISDENLESFGRERFFPSFPVGGARRNPKRRRSGGRESRAAAFATPQFTGLRNGGNRAGPLPVFLRSGKPQPSPTTHGDRIVRRNRLAGRSCLTPLDHRAAFLHAADKNGAAFSGIPHRRFAYGVLSQPHRERQLSSVPEKPHCPVHPFPIRQWRHSATLARRTTSTGVSHVRVCRNLFHVRATAED